MLHTTRVLALLALVALAPACHRACRSETPAPDAPTPVPVAEPADPDDESQEIALSTPDRHVLGTSVSCLVGANGVVPCGPDARPDCVDRYYRAIVVVDLGHEGRVGDATPSALEFLDGDGRVESRGRDWIDVQRLEPDAQRTTRLQVHAWLDRPPASTGPRCRLTLTVGDQAVVVKGEAVTNAWPTG